MADVTGPISSLPGTGHKLPAYMMCDDHPDRPAVKRIQGETDSYGSEMIDMCQECYDEYLAQREALGNGSHLGFCPSRACSGTKQQVPLFAYRDPDEGMYGPVYWYCADCRRSIREAYLDDERGDNAHVIPFDDGDYTDDRDDFDDEVGAPELFGFLYRGTSKIMMDRYQRNYVQLSLRDARKFLRKHKGKMRGHRLTMFRF